MIEKVNPCHPDKVADRIAGAIVDLCYSQKENPKVAVEVLIGHNECNIIIETDCFIDESVINEIVERIAEQRVYVNLKVVPQDVELANNQEKEIRCGDNGIFKGVPITREEEKLNDIAHIIYNITKSDGKYILNKNKLIVCQSRINTELAKELYKDIFKDLDIIVNPLGDWTGGINVDSGATNRKLGSDMYQSVTGGGLMGKDLSKADVSVNIYAWLKAQEIDKPVELCCAIGDTEIDGIPYKEIVNIARDYINSVGGFEKFAEWGLVKTKYKLPIKYTNEYNNSAKNGK